MIDGADPVLGLRVGTWEAVLAVMWEDDLQIVPSSDGSQWIPVRLGVSGDGIRIGDAIKSGEESIIISPEEPFEADPEGDGCGDPSELPLVEFLTEAHRQWREQVVTDSSEALPVVVSIPGAYDVEDENRFLTAVSVAGFNILGAIREPLTAAYYAGFHQEKEGTYVAVRVGTFWFDVAIVEPTTESPRVNTLARRSRADFGTELFERTLVNWLREEHSDALREKGDLAIRRSIREGVEGLNESTERTIQLFGEDGIELDDAVFDRALEGVVSELGKTLRDLLDDADITSDAVDDVIVGGAGSAYPVVVRAFEGSLASNVQCLGQDRPWDGPFAAGASLLGNLFGDDVEVADQTLRRLLAIETLTPEGSKYRRIPPSSEDDAHHVVVQTTEDDQTWGRFRIGTMHRSTGDVEQIEAFEVAGLPAAPAGEIRLEIQLEVSDTMVSECRCTASLQGSQSKTDLTVTSLTSSDFEGPWFALGDEDLDTVDVPGRNRFDPVYRRDPAADAYENLSPKQAIDHLVSIRNELWQAANNDTGMSPSELSVRVNKLDVGLHRSGVELITPEPGDPIDDTAHQIDAMEETDFPEGTIVELRQPGYRIDDTIESLARVVASKGPPPDAGERSDAESADESTADKTAEESQEAKKMDELPTDVTEDEPDVKSSEPSSGDTVAATDTDVEGQNTGQQSEDAPDPDWTENGDDGSPANSDG